MRTRTAMVLMIMAAAMPPLARAEVETSLFARAATDGSALGGVSFYDDVAQQNTYPNGFAMYDKNGATVFSGQTPPGLGARSVLVAFDGHIAAFISTTPTQTLVYSVGSAGFTILGTVPSWPVEGFMILTKSEIIMPLGLPGSSTITLTAYDRKMKKTKWSIVCGKYIYWLGKDVFAERNSTILSFFKKGKAFSYCTLANADDYFACGAAGNVVSWTVTDGTNGPLSYATKKKLVTTGMLLPEAGVVWDNFNRINKDMFYVQEPGVYPASTIHAYKLGSPFTWMASHVIEYLGDIVLDGKNIAFIIYHPTAGSRVEVWKSTMSGYLWDSGYGEGDISLLGNGVYCRTIETPTATTFVIFDKKGIVTTHVFMMP